MSKEVLSKNELVKRHVNNANQARKDAADNFNKGYRFSYSMEMRDSYMKLFRRYMELAACEELKARNIALEIGVEITHEVEQYQGLAIIFVYMMVPE